MWAFLDQIFLIFSKKLNIIFLDSLLNPGGMFDSSYFDNSKVIMFDSWKSSFLRKIFFIPNLT